MEQLTAREQFAQDYLLVINNDQEAYTEAHDLAHEYNLDKWLLGEEIKRQFEDFICESADLIEQHLSTTGANLIRQMLIGFGNDTFTAIAGEIIADIKESE
jgi:hypothetical protein